MTELITGIATPVAVLALVNLGKQFGVSGRWSALLAVLLGVGLNLAQWAWSEHAWFAAAAQGLTLGLAAAGLYDVAQGRQPEPERALLDEPEPPRATYPDSPYIDG